jgi:hypothetical protein
VATEYNEKVLDHWLYRSEKLFSAPSVISRWRQPSGGGTCCGREERCAAPPCSTGEVCRRDR